MNDDEHVTINGVAVENAKSSLILELFLLTHTMILWKSKEELLLPKTPQLLSIRSGKTEALP